MRKLSLIGLLFILILLVGLTVEARENNFWRKDLRATTYKKPAPELTCTDSDDGINYYEQGKTKGPYFLREKYLRNLIIPKIKDYWKKQVTITKTDRCLGYETLIEYYCQGRVIKSQRHVCEYGCYEGACREEPLEMREIRLKHYEGHAGHKYKLKLEGPRDYEMNIPFIYLNEDGTLTLGDDDDKLVLVETEPIQKEDYFIVFPGGESHGLRYDAVDRTNSLLQFTDVGTGGEILAPYDTDDGRIIGTFYVDGHSFTVKNASNTSIRDFDIFVDLDGDGVIDNDEPLDIIDMWGARVSVEQTRPDQIEMTLHGYETDLEITIGSEDGYLTATLNSGCRLRPTSDPEISRCRISHREILEWTSVPGESEEFVYSYSR